MSALLIVIFATIYIFSMVITPIIIVNTIQTSKAFKKSVTIISLLGIIIPGIGIISYVLDVMAMYASGYFKEKVTNSADARYNAILFGVEFLIMLLPILKMRHENGYYNIISFVTSYPNVSMRVFGYILIISSVLGALCNLIFRDTRKTVGINIVCNFVYFAIPILSSAYILEHDTDVFGTFVLFLMTIISIIGTLFSTIQACSTSPIPPESSDMVSVLEPLTNIKEEEPNVVFNLDNSVLILCPEDIVGSYCIPYGVKSIASSAFKNCEYITNVIIPETVITIGSYAFQDCMSLTEISIPSSVTNIDNFAFAGCMNLKDINILGYSTAIDESAFKFCPSLSIHCPKYSFAAAYADSCNIPATYI